MKVLLLVAFAAACKKPPPADTTDSRPPPPVDHLLPDEVVEGTEKVFGLGLPRQSHIVGRYTGSTSVRSPLPPEIVANFFRPRVKSGRCIVGASSTLFDRVVVPSRPDRQLTIEIRRSRTVSDETLITIDDVTVAPPATSIQPDEGWRRAGRTPDGKLIAPSRME